LNELIIRYLLANYVATYEPNMDLLKRLTDDIRRQYFATTFGVRKIWLLDGEHVC